MATIFKHSKGWYDLDSGRHYTRSDNLILIYEPGSPNAVPAFENPDDITSLSAMLDKLAEASTPTETTSAYERAIGSFVDNCFSVNRPTEEDLANSFVTDIIMDVFGVNLQTILADMIAYQESSPL